MNQFCSRLRFGLVLVLLVAVELGCKTVNIRPEESPPNLTFDVTAFGARGNDATPDTQAFRSAITACQQAGGGTVRVPAGTYVTAPLDMVSGMTLYLDAGAVILFSTDLQDFPLVETRWEGIMREGRRPCLWARGCRDVAIMGSGVIDGQGSVWWEQVRRLRRDRGGYPTSAQASTAASRPWETNALLRRPPLVQFRDCINVRIEGVTIQNSPFWTTHFLLSDNITVRNARFLAPETGPNTDAMDIDSCRNVVVENCYAAVGDDAFTLKSGKDEDGRRVGRPTENVTIRNCTVGHAHGGVVIGSETSGSVRHIRFLDCTFEGTQAGVRVKSTRGRGAVVEDVRADNIRMKNVGNTFIITMHYSRSDIEPISERTPRFNDIRLNNITSVNSRRAGIIEGLEEMPITNVSVSNFEVSAQEGISVTDAQNISFKHVRMTVDTPPALKSLRAVNVRVDDWIESQQGLPSTLPATTENSATQP